jgi:hypothetical protein
MSKIGGGVEIGEGLFCPERISWKNLEPNAATPTVAAPQTEPVG